MDRLAVGMELPRVRHRPDELDCFLFSAAIWMPHRIHYDLEYARSEGHRAVVVHGPLQGAYLGQMVFSWVSAMNGRLTGLRYRHRSPAFATESLVCRGEVVEVVVEGQEQRAVCDVWIEKEGSGERTTTGTAEVVVPIG